MPLGSDGEVLAAVKLWNDTSTVRECAEIHEALGGVERAIALAGNPILPGYTAPKVRWLKNHRPEIYARLATILLPHDYLNFLLTGQRGMECGDASGTGFLDVRRRTWSAEVLRAIDPQEDLGAKLPPLLPPSNPAAPAGRVQPRWAGELGLAGGVLVSAGGGDNMMGAIGTGAVESGVLTVSLGTSGTLYGHADRPVIAPSGEFAAFCSSTAGWLPLLCTLNCTAATERMRELLGIALEAFDPLLSRSRPGAGGVVGFPFFDGERTPNLPRGRACFFGLSSPNATPENLLRAVVEAIAFGLRAGLDGMGRAGLTFRKLRAIGGGANSREWLRILADVLGMEVTVPREPESAALGAALQALFCYLHENREPVGIGALTREHLALDEQRVFTPDPSRRSIYEEAYQGYLGHLAQLQTLYGGEDPRTEATRSNSKKGEVP